MIGKIPMGPAGPMAAVLMAVGYLGLSAAAAGAATPKVVYTNLNTVPTTVNNHANEDTFSLDSEYFPIGGMVEFTKRPGVLRSLTAQVDSFTCEHGVYSLENCFTLHTGKKFPYELTAEFYEVGANNEPVGAPFTSSTATFKLPYRPTTNVNCPSTVEGKGFGVNCDVGGVLATIEFKKFTPKVVLPEKAIIVITNTINDPTNYIVNVGLQAAYKEYREEKFIEEPALENGKPGVGSDPLPEDIFTKGHLNEEGWEGFQPVFEVVAAS